MPVRTLFPTRVYTARLQGAGTVALNRELLKETRRWNCDMPPSPPI